MSGRNLITLKYMESQQFMTQGQRGCIIAVSSGLNCSRDTPVVQEVASPLSREFSKLELLVVYVLQELCQGQCWSYHCNIFSCIWSTSCLWILWCLVYIGSRSCRLWWSPKYYVPQRDRSSEKWDKEYECNCFWIHYPNWFSSHCI